MRWQGTTATNNYLLFWLTLVTTVTSQQRQPCSTDNSITGYNTISDLNSAMTAILNSIVTTAGGGTQPKPPYRFTLCPRTIIHTDEILRPLLNGAEFICGASGSLSDMCVIQQDGNGSGSGNTAAAAAAVANQVIIADSTVAGYQLRNVTFRGITFSGSNQTSILAGAGSGTTAYFEDCQWNGFYGNSAIDLFLGTTTGTTSASGKKAMTVVIKGGMIQNGFARTIFNNNNGRLKINGLTVHDCQGTTAIVTNNGGSTILQNTNFTSNNYVTLAAAGTSSSLTVVNVDVTRSGVNLQQVFYAQGVGAQMNLTRVDIHDTDLAASTFFDGIVYADGAMGQVKQGQIQNNTGLEFGVIVYNASTATVLQSTFANNTAATGTLTSMFIALNNSKLYLQDINVTSNSGFTTYGFTGFQGFTQYYNATFEGGKVVFAVFIDQTSKFISSNNFFINVKSEGCPPPNQRQFIENVGSHCFFRGNGNCSGVCGVVKKNGTLAPTPAVSQFTAPPSMATSSPATEAPSEVVVTAVPTLVSLSPTTTPFARPPSTPPQAAPITTSTPSPSPAPFAPAVMPFASMVPTFGETGVMSLEPTGISFSTSEPTIGVVKKMKGKRRKKGKKKGSSAQKDEKGKTGEKGKSAPKWNNKSGKKAKGEGGTDMELETTPPPVPSSSVATLAPSMMTMIGTTTAMPNRPPVASPASPYSPAWSSPTLSPVSRLSLSPTRFIGSSPTSLSTTLASDQPFSSVSHSASPTSHSVSAVIIISPIASSSSISPSPSFPEVEVSDPSLEPSVSIIESSEQPTLVPVRSVAPQSVVSPSSDAPMLQQQPTHHHLDKKKKIDEKKGEKLVKKDKKDSATPASEKLVDGHSTTPNVFERGTPKSSRRRGARGL